MTTFTPRHSGTVLRDRARPPTEAELAEIPWLQRLTPIERQRAVDLPDGGCGNGTVVKANELFAPIPAPMPCEHRVQLGRRHVLRIRT